MNGAHKHSDDVSCDHVVHGEDVAKDVWEWVRAVLLALAGEGEEEGVGGGGEGGGEAQGSGVASGTREI